MNNTSELQQEESKDLFILTLHNLIKNANELSEHGSLDRITGNTKVFKFLIINFQIITEFFLKRNGSLINTIILKIKEFRLELAKRMDINYGSGTYIIEFLELLNSMDDFENLLKSKGFYIQPIEIVFGNEIDINEN